MRSNKVVIVKKDPKAMGKEPVTTKEKKSVSKVPVTQSDKEASEMKERKESHKQESKEQKEATKGEHLDHPQLQGPGAQHLMNDLAYHLHHPQFGLKGPKLPAKNPKC